MNLSVVLLLTPISSRKPRNTMVLTCKKNITIGYFYFGRSDMLFDPMEHCHFNQSLCGICWFQFDSFFVL